MNLINLEMMTATEKVAEALVMRGLFVEVKEGVLFFSEKCAKGDIKDVKSLLSLQSNLLSLYTDALSNIGISSFNWVSNVRNISSTAVSC